jgi:redox-sensitive bicupin YhaK (pirin superfamily)
MFWSHKIPRHAVKDAAGRSSELSIIAGRLGAVTPLAPPPRSWASRPDTDVAIWTLELEPQARFTLPAASPGSNRMLYYFRGQSLSVGGAKVTSGQALELRADLPAALENGSEKSECLLLQARPIGEPVAQRGPFVMNSQAEIQQAFSDYRRTRFGGWPWPSSGPVHGLEGERFARHANGNVERAT